MIRINNIKLKTDNTDVLGAAARRLKIKPECISALYIRRRSLDARKKDDIHYIYSVDVETDNESKILKGCRDKNVSPSSYKKYKLPEGPFALEKRPVVAGFGPAGMFAALALAEMGLRPIVLERGRAVDRRTEDVESFWNGGRFNPESNVQFGEGGAGTFSDGKLTTRIKDNRSLYVLINSLRPARRRKLPTTRSRI